MWNLIANNIRNDDVTRLIHTTGLMYAIPDFYALLWVPRSKLQMSTVYHHVAVTFFALINLAHNYDQPNLIWEAMLVYAIMSMYTGVVNFYLGARFLLDINDKRQNKYRSWLALYALLVYAASITVNWSYQAYAIVNSINRDLTQIGGSFGNSNLTKRVKANSLPGVVCSIWPSFNAPFVWNPNIWMELLNIISRSTTLITTFAYCAILKFIIVDDIILIKKLRSEISLKK
jgi:hypothetical protein